MAAGAGQAGWLPLCPGNPQGCMQVAWGGAMWVWRQSSVDLMGPWSGEYCMCRCWYVLHYASSGPSSCDIDVLVPRRNSSNVQGLVW